MKAIGRRGILRGLAASALASPLTQLFQMHTGRAQQAGPVPKVVFFYTPCGVVPNVWHPTETGRVFTLPRLSAPLAPHQADCIFLDGVSMYPLNDHQGGSQQLLAGDEKDVMTLDLQLGEFLKETAPFSSIQLGIQTRISKGGSAAAPHPHFSRISLKQEVFAEDNPLAAFASIFGTETSGAPMTDGTVSLLAQRRKSILDSSLSDVTALSSRLPGSEKQKLVTFTESIRALERRLTDPSTMAPSCNDFSTFNPGDFAVPQVDNPNQASYQQTANRTVVSDLQLETARLALACGRTRVVSIVYEHTNAHNPIEGLGPFGVHDSSHYNAPPGQLTGNATQEQKDAKMNAWQAYRVWYAERLAQFIQMLKDTPDPLGGSLFDSTIVMHGSELGDSGPHKTDRIPYVFAGGRSLGFQLGQALNFSGAVPEAGGQHPGIRNLAHSTLLTIVAKTMGLPLASPLFGYSGPQALDPQSIGVV